MMNERITKEQFGKIFNLICEIQKVCSEADTSSINMWLAHVAPDEDESVNELEMDILNVGTCYNIAFKIAIGCVERMAYELLSNNEDMHEFVMCMGAWSIYDKSGETINDERISELRDFIDEWDGFLRLTGEPMRFTAQGPKITNW